MPRKKQSTPSPTDLSEQQVYDVFEFAKNMMNTYPNIFTPQLVNQRLQDVGLNPVKGDQQKIESALLDPKNNENDLIGFSENFELTDMLYKRILAYLGNMLSFDLTYTCMNASQDDYNSPAYKKDIAKVYDFLDKFNIKQEFKKVLRQILRQEEYYCVLRDESDTKYTLQELPQQYCITTGRWEYGFLFDMNLYWFMQPGVSIDMYPDVFKRLYKKVFSGKNGVNYNPGTTIDKRTGTYVYYIQLSPKDNFWSWKFNPDIASRVPFLSPLFADLIIKPTVRQLQTNTYIIEATKIMVGLIPLLEQNKSGNIKDSLAISPETAGKFLSLLRSGVNETIKLGAVPFSDLKVLDFKPSDKSMLESYSKTTTAMSGINSRLIYANDKMSNIESQLSMNVDEYLMNYTYPYFEDFLNYHINKRTKKYKFKFKLQGSEFDLDKQNRLDRAMSIADKGLVLPHLFASALGMLPRDLERMLEEANATGFADKLIPLLNIYNQSPSGDNGGRPRKKDSQLSDNGEATRNNSSNLGRGGDI